MLRQLVDVRVSVDDVGLESSCVGDRDRASFGTVLGSTLGAAFGTDWGLTQDWVWTDSGLTQDWVWCWVNPVSCRIGALLALVAQGDSLRA